MIATPQTDDSGAPVLSVENLTTEIATDRGTARVVCEVDLSIAPGRVVGLVGESGSGKSLTAMSILGLVPPAILHRVSGSVRLGGEELIGADRRRLRRVRGERIGMVFQNPATSLNPVFTIGDQLAETLRARGLSGSEAIRRRSVELLDQVRIPDAAARLDSYPWELSGGMQQRVMIALALAGDPELLIADEPTTALDVTVQARVLALVRRLVAERRMAVLLITHDLGVVAETCDEVCVMYAGRIVERAPCAELFESPLHPYTQGLLDSVRRLDAGRTAGELAAIPGQAPGPADLPGGCSFRDRCPQAMGACAGKFPPETGANGRRVRCYLHR